MRGKARVLLITNELDRSARNGPIDAFELMATQGEVASVHVVSHAAGWVAPGHAVHVSVMNSIKESRPDVVVVWTKTRYPSTDRQKAELESALGARFVAYWEGDAWGRSKPTTSTAAWWMRRSNIVFSVAGPPQASSFVDLGAPAVQLIPHLYCHVQFAEAERTEPNHQTRCDAVMIGGNYGRVPGLTGMPGSFGRWQLAARMRMSLGKRFELHGPGWPRRWSSGPIAYPGQIEAIQKGRLTVNWDHFPMHQSYASDRLAISLLAGRPHVTTAHPNMTWTPNESVGLYQEPSPRLVQARSLELLDRDPHETLRMGVEGWKWTRFRLSNREGARFMLSRAIDGIAPPSMEPWTILPPPWVANGPGRNATSSAG